MTTKRPLGPLLMQLTSLLFERQLWLDLQWVSRDSNTEADDLTNEEFSKFRPEHRRPLSYADLELGLTTRLMAVEAEFGNRLSSAHEEKTSRDRQGCVGRTRKRAAAEPWK